jgi:transcriptional regulator with XRE-family HTH domain
MLVQRVLKEAPFSMRQLADAEGLSYGGVRGWAMGNRTPTPDNIRRLAEGIRKQSERLAELATELDAATAAEGDGE